MVEPVDEPARRSQTTFRLWKIATTVVIGLGVGIGGAVWKNRDVFFDPPTVDITFSLECRQLEGNLGQRVPFFPWYDWFTDEQNDDHIQKIMRTELHADWYATGVRLAFNHGVVDDSSTYAATRLRIVEATQEYIAMRGEAGFRANGRIDRRTGYGEITQYPSGKLQCSALADIIDRHGDHVAADDYRKSCEFATKSNFLLGPVVRNHLFRCKPSSPGLF